MEKTNFDRSEALTHYQFYLENCVDEEKLEIPLSFETWVENYYQESKDFCQQNNIKLEDY
jgi:hypothetical protein